MITQFNKTSVKVEQPSSSRTWLVCRPKLLTLAAAVFAVSASGVWAQVAPPNESAKKPGLDPNKPIEMQVRRGAGGAMQQLPEPTPSPDGPQPKWVIEQSNLTIPSVWLGQPLRCGFTIRNEGEGDLKIEAKGG
ncbi:MAG: hypothetical protein JSU63_01105 [Phycisphaerales bacterium]|nr:MAG: hypothetical protein JSU63_01105 [Phycisphaerales bacterium]